MRENWRGLDCRKITTKLGEIQTNDNLLILACDEKKLEKIEELETKQEELVDELGPYKIKTRERIAKESGFVYVGILSGGAMIGEKLGASSENRLTIILENGQRIGPFQKVDDTGAGNYLVYESFNTGQSPFGTYKFIDRNGNTVHNFGGDEAVHFKGEFRYSKGDPIRILYLDPVSGQVTRTAFLRPDGVMLMSLPGAHSVTYSEGYVWIEDSTDRAKVLYDRDGEEIRRENAFSAVYPFQNGWALAVTHQGAFCQVYKISPKGKPVNLDIRVGLNKNLQQEIRRYDNICFSRDIKGKPFYFTLDGGTLTLPVTGDTVERLYEKEGLIQIKVAGGVRVFNLDGKDHYKKLFERFEDFSEGLAAVMEPGGEWYYTDTKGNKIIPETKSEILLAFPFKHGLASVKDEQGWFLIDRTGKDICRGKRYSSYFEYDGQGVFAASDNSAYLDEWGEELFN